MDLLSLDNFFTLAMLIMLQAVLGFDNLLYISLESKKAPLEKQSMVRKYGIAIAIILRILLLFALVSVIDYFQEPIFKIIYPSVINSSFNIHSLIVLLGGIFIVYTSIKEIWHMISYEQENKMLTERKSVSTKKVIIMIVIMNVVFSFDSILSAMALAKNPDNTYQIYLITTAIVIGGLLMIWLADKVSSFLEKNKMYEVLGLFILFLVGIMLLTEGGHLAELEIFKNKITPMNKTTFYFILIILILIDIVQGKYQKKLLKTQKNKVNL